MLASSVCLNTTPPPHLHYTQPSTPSHYSLLHMLTPLTPPHPHTTHSSTRSHHSLLHTLTPYTHLPILCTLLTLTRSIVCNLHIHSRLQEIADAGVSVVIAATHLVLHSGLIVSRTSESAEINCSESTQHPITLCVDKE